MAGQIIKRGDSFLLRVPLGRDAAGKRLYKNATFRGTKKEAEKELTKLLRLRDTGQLQAARKETVGEYLELWLETTAKPSVRARSLHSYRETAKRYVLPYVADLRLSAVNPADVRAWLTKLGAKGLSPRTIRKAHEVLRNALEQAVVDSLILTNPARGRLVRKALPKMERKERTTIPPEKIPAFIEAAEEERLGAYFLLLLTGGLRPSEGLALRWTDLRGDTIRVERVLVDVERQPLYFAPTKSRESTRAIVLPKFTLEALKDWKRRQAEERLKAGPAWTDNGLIFPDEVGQPLRQDNTRIPFGRLLKRAELPPMRIYDLRHSAATLLLEAGEDLTVVKERLGHSTIVLTADTYKHARRGSQERAAGKFDQLASGG